MARRRILWGRVFASACVLIALIFLLGACVSSCFGGDDNNSSTPGPIIVPTPGSSLTGPTSSAQDSTPVAPSDAALSSYTEITVEPAQIYSGNLVLVNSSYPSHLSEDELALEAVSYAEGKPDCYTVSYPARTFLNGTALSSFNKLMEAYFASTANKEIMVNDGYLAKGSAKSTDESTTGLSIQLHLNKAAGGFAYITNTSPYSWLYEHMADYGYILRYPEGKEEQTGNTATDTVIRYVGTPHAKYMDAYNLCLEEYLDLLKEKYTYGKGMLHYEGHIIYYVPANLTGSTTVPVPTSENYTISGNNTDGFIVTVDEGE